MCRSCPFVEGGWFSYTLDIQLGAHTHTHTWVGRRHRPQARMLMHTRTHTHTYTQRSHTHIHTRRTEDTECLLMQDSTAHVEATAHPLTHVPPH